MGGSLPNPIAYSEISQYAKDHGFHGDDFDELVELVIAQDNVFLKHDAERRQKEADALKQKTRTNRR